MYTPNSPCVEAGSSLIEKLFSLSPKCICAINFTMEDNQFYVLVRLLGWVNHIYGSLNCKNCSATGTI